jgi:non-heme chloroperoxidase
MESMIPVNFRRSISNAIHKNARLKIYPGGPHGLTATEKDQVNADLLAFIKG